MIMYGFTLSLYTSCIYSLLPSLTLFCVCWTSGTIHVAFIAWASHIPPHEMKLPKFNHEGSSVLE